MADQEQTTEEQQQLPRLNFRQQAFVNAYLGEAMGNATEAAKLAGYSAVKRSTLGEMGSQLLKNLKVRAHIDARVDELAMTAEEVLGRLAEQARGDMGQFVEGELYGKPKIVMKKIEGEANTRLIKRLTVTEMGGAQSVQVELYDAQAALVQLGKYHKLFTDKTELTGKDGIPLFKAYQDVDIDRV